uniref:FYVE-type domain-containing protein n=1 Tax=Hyaloperonospora arabidopsidis (strain Emoy2) TaxID=559515 RepID=M4BX74_HYAAE
MEHYESIADQLVAETLQASEGFIADCRSVDLERWKVVIQKERMTAYRSRGTQRKRGRRDRFDTEEAVESSFVHRPKLYSIDSSSTFGDLMMGRGHSHLAGEMSQDESSMVHGDSDYYENSRIDMEAPDQSVLGKSRPPNTPMIFGCGVVSGSVDDAGLGFLADTEDRSIMRAATNKDGNMKDIRILAQIRGPTREDPFRFLGIKWTSHFSSKAVDKPRDVVSLESTGLTLDSSGQRVCYFLSHSVEIEEVPEYRKRGLVRLRMSSCRIVRPYSTQGEVEVYCRGFCNAGGLFRIRKSTQLFCESLLDTAQLVEESYLKKLAWFVHAYARRINTDKEVDKHEGCACCHKLPTKGFKKLLENNTTCFLCRCNVCKKCTVKKQLPIDSTSTKSIDFCSTCYVKAKKLSAWKVAVATLPRV